LREGQRGFCFIRQAREEGIVMTSYGRASGFCIDPIEKKPLNHFYPGTSVLSFGTAGCNLGCRFCQNWDISKAREFDRLSEWASPEVVVETALQFGCRSIAFTYNDPVIFAEYAIDCAKEAQQRGLKTVVVSAGYIAPQARQEFFAHIDAANIDLKAFTDQFYEQLCFARLEPVLDTLCWLKQKTQVWLEVTTLLIPGQNDSEAEIARLSAWFIRNLGPDVPLHFTAFHPAFKLLEVPPTRATTLIRARRQARQAGIRYVYTGNIYNPTGQATTCAACGQLLIERDGYHLGRWNLTETGGCQYCGMSLPGHFDPKPGQWEARRRQLSFNNKG
jgi:pyruvate formate lyase activating enzyme